MSKVKEYSQPRSRVVATAQETSDERDPARREGADEAADGEDTGDDPGERETVRKRSAGGLG
jgi:hypothetical protein